MTREATSGPRAVLREGARLATFAGILTGTTALWEADRRRLPPERHEARKEELRHMTSRGILKTFGVQLHREGAVPPRTGARLVVANHRAALDIGVLLAEVGGTFLSRADLAEWPVVGRLAREADTIFVDREDRSSGASAIRAMRRRLREGGSVMIFPEGATFVGDEVRSFQPGAFIAARGLPVEILPVGLAYPPGTEYVGVSFVEHVRQLARRRRTDVGVVVGEPFAAEGRPAEIAAHAHRVVQTLTSRARALSSRS